MHPELALLALCCLVWGNALAYAATLYVAQDGDGTDGLTWETALTTIGAAITASASGDEIWIKEGDYQESIVLPDCAIAIRGGFVGSETSPEDREIGIHTTTVGDASHEEATISHENFVFTGSWPVHIEDLTIRGSEGGCIDFFERYDAVHFTLRRLVCSFDAEGKSGNTFKSIGVLSLLMDSCRFIQKGFSEADSFTVPYVMFLDAYYAEIRNSLISLDVDPQMSFRSFATVLRIPQSNVYLSRDGVDVVCSVVYRTPSASDVGSIRGRPSDPGVPVAVRATNSIFVGDTSVIEDDFVYSNVFDASAAEGIGNLSVDPLFVNPEEGDFRLQANSPCIDSGTLVALAEDIEGNPRPVDIPGVGHSGAAAFDMGAYELQKVDLPLHGDLNGDGAVNQLDLFLFQKEWMEAKSQEGKQRFE
jgi:hypothetical protein